MAPTADGARVDLHTLTPRHPDAPPRPKAVGLRVDYTPRSSQPKPGRCPAQQHKPSQPSRGAAPHNSTSPPDGVCTKTTGRCRKPEVSSRGLGCPQIQNTPQGGWEGKQTLALKGLLVQSPPDGVQARRVGPPGFGVSPRTAVGGWVETTWKALHWIREAQALRPSPPGRPGSRGERIAPAASETSSAQGPRKRRGCRTRRCRLRP